MWEAVEAKAGKIKIGKIKGKKEEKTSSRRMGDLG